MKKFTRSPRIEVTRNRKSEYNYKLIGKNGKVLVHCNQGFKRKQALFRNIEAVSKSFSPTGFNSDVECFSGDQFCGFVLRISAPEWSEFLPIIFL